MRYLLPLILLSCSICQAQQKAGRTFTFNQVGWTFELPPDFKLMDSAVSAQFSERGKKAIEEANDVTADLSRTKTLITANRNAMNYFSSTITPFDPRTDGDYAVSNKSVKDMLFTTFTQKMSTAKIDSSTSQITLDGLTFDQFHVTIMLNQQLSLHMYLLSRLHKGYDFGISYLYSDEITRQEIEGILKSSRFKNEQ